jgi:hypothetical protein
MQASNPYAQFVRGASAEDMIIDEKTTKMQHLAAALFIIGMIALFVAGVYLGVKLIIVTWGLWMTGGILGFLKWYFLYTLVSIPIYIVAAGVGILFKWGMKALFNLFGKKEPKPRAQKTTRGGRVYEVRGARMA